MILFHKLYLTICKTSFKGIENNVKGLTMFTAAVFIVGEMSGTGVLSLPFGN